MNFYPFSFFIIFAGTIYHIYKNWVNKEFIKIPIIPQQFLKYKENWNVLISSYCLYSVIQNKPYHLYNIISLSGKTDAQ